MRYALTDKEWKRAWNMELIEVKNPERCDLYDDFAVRPHFWIPAFAGMTKS